MTGSLASRRTVPLLPIRIGKEEESASDHHRGLPICRSAVQQHCALLNDGLRPPPSSARHSLASTRVKNLFPEPSSARHSIFLQCTTADSLGHCSAHLRVPPICPAVYNGGLTEMEEDIALPRPICHPVVQQRRGALCNCLCLTPAILSSSGAAVHYYGATRMKECTASAYQRSSARHSVVQQSIGVQWRARSNKGGHCLCPAPSQRCSLVYCQQSSSAAPSTIHDPVLQRCTLAGPFGARRTLPLPIIQQRSPFRRPALQQRRCTGHNDGPT